MIKEIIKDNKLTCTVAEYTAYLKTIVVDTSKLDKTLATKCLFTKKYNGHKIENLAGGKYYYYLTILGATYLQNIVPYVSGFVGLDDKNIDKVIADHKMKLIDNYVQGEKMRLTIIHYTPKIK